MRRLWSRLAVAGMALALLPIRGAGALETPLITAAAPTVFFLETSEGLAQQADVTFGAAPGKKVVVTVSLNGGSRHTEVGGDSVSARVGVPDTDRSGTALFSVDGGSPFAKAWEPQRKWDVWLMPSTHIDMYSTENAPYTPKQHADVIESALDLLEGHSDYRYQIENGLAVEEFLRFRPGERSRLAAAFASGRLAVGGQYTGLHQAEASDESIVQGQYGYEGTRAALRDLGTQPNAGIVYDVPGVTLQAPQLVAASGMKYLLFSPNHSYRLYERLRLPWLFRWKSPDGSSVLAWRTAWNYGYEKNQYYNLQGSWEAAEATLGTMLRDREAGVYRNPYGEANAPDPNLAFPFHDLLILWDYGDNTPATDEPINFVAGWNARWAYPRFRLGTFSDFMDHVGETYDPALIPERSGEVLDAWTFVVMSQGLINEFTRRAKRELPAAATWSSLAARLGGPAFPREGIGKAWQRIGWTEAHDWFYGSYPLADVTGLPIPNPHLPLPFNAGEGKVPAFMTPDLDKAAWAREAERIGRQTAADGARAFAGLVASDGDAVVVLNNGTETRSDLVAIPATRRHVIDAATGLEVPTQRIPGARWAAGLGARPVMAIGAVEDAEAQQTGDVTVFVAPDVPGLGYKRFRLSESPGGPPGDIGRDPAYRVSFDPVTGAIASITKDARELVDPGSPWKLGELLVGQPATDFGDIFDEPQPFKNALQLLTAQSMQVVAGGFPGAAVALGCGPVLCETRVTGVVADEHRSMSVVTYRALDRVDLVISTALTKAKQERFVVSMPLAGSVDEIRYSEPFASHHVGADEAPSEPSVHRQLTDWIEVGDDNGRATAVTSPDVGPFTVGRPDVNLMTGQFTKPAQPWYYPVVVDSTAGGAVSVGTYVARFSISAGEPGVGARLAESEREPLRAAVIGAGTGPLGSATASLLRVEGGRVTAVKIPAEGEGLLVRVLAGGGPLVVEADPSLGLGPPRRATLREDPYGDPVTGAITSRPYEIVTLLFRPLESGS